MDNDLIQMLIAAMQQNDTGGLQQELSAYDALGKEGFARQTGLGTMDQRMRVADQNTAATQALLEKQLAQANSAGQPSGKAHSSVGGAVAGGIGDVLGSILGGIKSHETMGQMEDLNTQQADMQQAMLGQQDAGRMEAGSARYEAMRRFLEQQQQAKQPVIQSGIPGGKPSFGIPGLTLDPRLFGG